MSYGAPSQDGEFAWCEGNMGVLCTNAMASQHWGKGTKFWQADFFGYLFTLNINKE